MTSPGRAPSTPRPGRRRPSAAGRSSPCQPRTSSVAPLLERPAERARGVDRQPAERVPVDVDQVGVVDHEARRKRRQRVGRVERLGVLPARHVHGASSHAAAVPGLLGGVDVLEVPLPRAAPRGDPRRPTPRRGSRSRCSSGPGRCRRRRRGSGAGGRRAAAAPAARPAASAPARRRPGAPAARRRRRRRGRAATVGDVAHPGLGDGPPPAPAARRRAPRRAGGPRPRAPGARRPSGRRAETRRRSSGASSSARWSIPAATSSNVVGQPPPLPSLRYSRFQAASRAAARSAHRSSIRWRS